MTDGPKPEGMVDWPVPCGLARIKEYGINNVRSVHCIVPVAAGVHLYHFASNKTRRALFSIEHAHLFFTQLYRRPVVERASLPVSV